MTYPVPQSIGTAYGVPGDWAAGHHTGEDYLSPNGTQAKAVLPGKVVYAGWNGWGSAYGRTVILEHIINGVTYRVIYAHLAEWMVSTGDKVVPGQTIGRTNNSGNSTGPHLHFEVRHFPYNYGDDVNPKTVTSITNPIPAPTPGTQTAFDVSFWNIQSTRWGAGPWKPRLPGITKEIVGEASINGFAEIYYESEANDLLLALESDGTDFTRVSGHAGLEFFYDANKWQLERPVKPGGYASGIQGRYALVVHLTRKSTGQHVAFVLTHGPVTYDSLKTQFGQWLVKLLGQIDGPIVLFGDFNRSANDKSPRKEIRAAGYRDMRELAAITNEPYKEFPSKGWNLSDIYVDRNDQYNDTIVGGIIDITSPVLSDHRRIEATVKVIA